MSVDRTKQQGVSLVLAIFILVVLSLLGAAMIKILSAGADTVAREVISTRAFLAAESGAQRQLNAIFTPGAATNLAACADAANTPRTNTYTLGGLLTCADASVVCEYQLVDGINYFTVASTGRCGPVGDQAVRIVEVQARDL